MTVSVLKRFEVFPLLTCHLTLAQPISLFRRHGCTKHCCDSGGMCVSSSKASVRVYSLKSCQIAVLFALHKLLSCIGRLSLTTWLIGDTVSFITRSHMREVTQEWRGLSWNYLLVLWFSKDDTVTNTEQLVCVYSDRNYWLLLYPLHTNGWMMRLMTEGDSRGVSDVTGWSSFMFPSTTGDLKQTVRTSSHRD